MRYARRIEFYVNLVSSDCCFQRIFFSYNIIMCIVLCKCTTSRVYIMGAAVVRANLYHYIILHYGLVDIIIVKNMFSLFVYNIYKIKMIMAREE